MTATPSRDVAPDRAPLRAFGQGEPGAASPLSEVIRDRVAAGGPVVIVFDDDPTGSQVVSGVPILTSWDDDALDWAFSFDARMVFVLTNTRSLSPADAADLLRGAMAAVETAAARAGFDYVVACRGDSTLRGHFPLETDVVSDALSDFGRQVDGVLLVPAYVEAGRYTIDGTHYVELGGELIPVGETDYARDGTFGFTESRLAKYVEERTHGRVPAADVVAISLDDLRDGGVSRVADLLVNVHGGAVVAVDAATRADLDVFVLGVLEAEERGKRFIYRAGPSFVAARVGMEPGAPVRPTVRPGAHGLIVVGSHVELTGRQIAHVQRLSGIRTVTIDASGLIDPARRAGVIADAAAEAAGALRDSDVLVMTSRALVLGSDAQHSLEIARSVSDGVVQVVREVQAACTPAWVIAKGGITSHDVAVKGLGIRRAVVVGQLFPGMTSVWMSVAEEGEQAPGGLPYVVFAGNVGDDGSMAAAVRILRGDDRA